MSNPIQCKRNNRTEKQKTKQNQKPKKKPVVLNGLDWFLIPLVETDPIRSNPIQNIYNCIYTII